MWSERKLRYSSEIQRNIENEKKPDELSTASLFSIWSIQSCILSLSLSLSLSIYLLKISPWNITQLRPTASFACLPTSPADMMLLQLSTSLFLSSSVCRHRRMLDCMLCISCDYTGRHRTASHDSEAYYIHLYSPMNGRKNAI